MKKLYVLLLSVIALVLVTGCGKEDYEKYKSYVENGPISCKYEAMSDTYSYLGDIKYITITATLKDVSINYELKNGSSYNGKIVTFKFNNKNEVTGVTEESYNKFDKYTIYLKNGSDPLFNYQNFLAQYAVHNTCPEMLRVLPGNVHDRKETTQGRLYDTDYGSAVTRYFQFNKYIYVDERPEETKPNPCNVTNISCHHTAAVSCNTYTFNTKLDGEINVELGYMMNKDGVSLDKYFEVYSQYGDDIAYNYGGNKGRGVARLGSYDYVIETVDWDNLFPYTCGYANADDMMIYEKDIAGSINAYITTNNSKIIEEYDMFGEPDESYKRTPVEYTGDKNKIVLPIIDIPEIALCMQDSVLKTFRIMGMLLFVLKILVPLIIIILGTIDFVKALLDTGDKANKEAINMLVKRFIIGVIIFMLPTIIDFALSFVDGAKEASSHYTACTGCLFHPFDADTCDVVEDN